MQRFLIAFLALAVMFGMWAMPAEALYRTGTASGSAIQAGGDGGTANQIDLAGDIVASYTSTAGNDTSFKSTAGQTDSVSVKAVYGDTAAAVGASSATVAPGGVSTFTMRVVNWANISDQIKIDNDTPTGLSKDSVTIKVNGVIVWKGGTPDTYAPYTLPLLASGADTAVTISYEHDTVGALGQCVALIKTTPNNGVGGDAGGYTGNNNDSYAGDGNAAVSFTVTVNQINVLIRVDQDPILMPVGYNGPVGDSVPGATLTYVIRYDNDGNDTAINFILKAKIPQNTSLAQADTALASPHTGATATVTITDDTGTVVLASNPTASRIQWTFSKGVDPNNGDAVGVVDATVADVDAGLMKFKVYIK